MHTIDLIEVREVLMGAVSTIELTEAVMGVIEGMIFDIEVEAQAEKILTQVWLVCVMVCDGM